MGNIWKIFHLSALFCRLLNMSNLLIKTVMRSLFAVTSRKRAMNKAKGILEDYMKLADGLSTEAGHRFVGVPPMRGVDEDMHRWSFYMILEHNTIVNRSISATIQQLVRGDALRGAAALDPKKDVLPSQSAGEEKLQEFRDSVNEHLRMLSTLGRLRETKTAPHPIFGNFDAHKWTCMFSFHLGLHYKQAQHVVRSVKAEQDACS
jgi:hypothetical protein